jgi:hypothetical protein
LLEVLDDEGVSHQHSTSKTIMDSLMNPLSPPTYKTFNFDPNSDGKKDEFGIQIKFKMDPTKVRKVRVYCLFDYYLQYRLKLKMQTLATVEVDTPSGASKIKAEGPLNFV